MDLANPSGFVLGTGFVVLVGDNPFYLFAFSSSSTSFIPRFSTSVRVVSNESAQRRSLSDSSCVSLISSRTF